MLTLRPMRASDCGLLFAWANDPDTRRCSIHSEPISWPAHVAWFGRKRSDSDCLLLIGEDETGKPVGQIRFDIANEEAVISISLDRAQRGKGYASRLLLQALSVLRERTLVQQVHAWIKPDNIPSQRAFERAGFCHQGLEPQQGLPLCHYTLHLPDSQITGK